MLPLSITLRPLYDSLAESFTGANPILVLAALGALVFGAAFAYRAAIYSTVRSTGASIYTPRWRRIEGLTGYGAFAVGVVAGLICFGEAASVVLCGGCFYLIHLGVIVQALEDNSRSPLRGFQDSLSFSDSSR